MFWLLELNEETKIIYHKSLCCEFEGMVGILEGMVCISEATVI